MMGCLGEPPRCFGSSPLLVLPPGASSTGGNGSAPRGWRSPAVLSPWSSIIFDHQGVHRRGAVGHTAPHRGVSESLRLACTALPTDQQSWARCRYRETVNAVIEARHRVRIAAGAATLWCAAIWAVAMQLTRESRPRIALAIPLLIAGTALVVVASRAGRAIAIAAAALVMIFAFAAILSVGLLYIPPAIALAFAAGGVVQKKKTAN